MGATATLLVACPDQKGLVARLAGFVYGHGGNIVHADHHTDFEAGLFLSRIEWELEGFALEPEAIASAFAALAEETGARWSLRFSDRRPRIAIWCSRQDHCLLDLLWRHKAGELPADIAFVLSNHADLAPVAEGFGLPFHHLPVSAATKAECEADALELLHREGVELVVLAKYMQVLSPAFLASFPSVLNIHHSFLPAFVGAQPYHQAFARGVKVIGATAHYVTTDLDAGPIVEQDVARISHRDTVQDLIRKGKDLERVVLARAVRLHLRNRVLVYGNRTVVFE